MKQGIELEGVIVAQHRTCFDVRLTERPDILVSAVESGRIKRHNVWLVPGDKCLVELCPYEMTKGRITRRL